MTAPGVFRATDLIRLLAERHPAGEWAFLEQVANSTGTGARGWADAVAMNLWPSRGLAVHGFEIKVSRGDWVKELSKPDKAENIAKYCDYWWLVIHDAACVKPGELPDGWGLMAPTTRGDKTSLKVWQEARRKEAQPLDRGFVGAILRQQGKADVAAENKVREKAISAGIDRYREHMEKEAERVRKKERTLNAFIAPFEKIMGKKYMEGLEWGGEERLDERLKELALFGKALEAMKNGADPIKHILGPYGDLNMVRTRLRESLAAIDTLEEHATALLEGPALHDLPSTEDAS